MQQPRLIRRPKRHRIRHGIGYSDVRNGLGYSDVNNGLGYSDVRNGLGYSDVLNKDSEFQNLTNGNFFFKKFVSDEH